MTTLSRRWNSLPVRRQLVVIMGLSGVAGLVWTIFLACGCSLWSPLFKVLHLKNTERVRCPTTWREPPLTLGGSFERGFGVTYAEQTWLALCLSSGELTGKRTGEASPLEGDEQSVSLEVMRVGRMTSGWPVRAFEWQLIGLTPPVLHEEVVPGIRVRKKYPEVDRRPQIRAFLKRSGAAQAPLFLDVSTRNGWAASGIPIVPVWDGLFINVLFWSMLIGAFVSIKAFARRYFRWRKNLCLQCGYHSLGFARCPECGRNADCHTLGER
jgi:hypothetical protein